MRNSRMATAALGAALSAAAITAAGTANAALPQVPSVDIAIPNPGPFPPLSGLGVAPSGDLRLGFHGLPPAAARGTTGWGLHSASHRAHHRRAAKHRAGWG